MATVHRSASPCCTSAADGVGHVLARQGFDAPFIFRSLLLPLTTVLAGYLREQAQQAEAALQERLRQSNALNEATAALGASLELEAVLRAAVAAAAQLFGSPISRAATVERPRRRHLVAAKADLSPRGAEDGPIERALERLCARYAQRANQRTGDDLDHRRLSCHRARRRSSMMLALPTRQTSLATVALAVPPNATVTLDSDILDAFVERITLAIENASLYRTLAGRSNDLQRAYSDLATAHQELLGVDEMKTELPGERLARAAHAADLDPLRSPSSCSPTRTTRRCSKEFLRIINSESRAPDAPGERRPRHHQDRGRAAWTGRWRTLDLPTLLRDSARTFGTADREAASLTFRPGHRATAAADLRRPRPPAAGRRQPAKQRDEVHAHSGGDHAARRAARRRNRASPCRIRASALPRDDQERIFEKFQQVGDTLTDKPRGTGLGLAICRDIVEYHQGTPRRRARQPGDGQHVHRARCPSRSHATLEGRRLMAHQPRAQLGSNAAQRDR